MAFKIAEAFVEIKGDKGKFSKTVSGAKREMAGFAQSATKNLKKVAIGLTAIGVAAAAAATIITVVLTKAIIRAGTSVVKTAIKYDKLKIGLIAITGSAKEAGIQLRRLRVLAEAPGLGFEQAIQGSIALQAAGLSAELAEKALSSFGNALAVVGKGAAELSRVNVQLAQIAAKTSGFGADIRVLKEAIPALGPVISKAFDGKPLEDVTITGKELIEVLITGLNELGRAGDSVGNNINNLRTSFDLLKKTIGDTMLDITSDTAKTLTGIIDNIAKIIPVWKEYRDEISEVFQKIAVIVIETTGEMMKGMFGIISAAAPLIFMPLQNAAVKWFRDFAAGFSVAVNAVMRAARVITQKQYEDFLVALIESNQDANNKSAENFKKEYATAIKSAVDVSIKGLPKIGKVFGESLEEVLALIETITTKIPKAVVEPVKKAVDELAKLKPPGDLDFLVKFDKKAAADAMKALDQRAEGIRRIALFNKELDEESEKRQKSFTERLRGIFRLLEAAHQKRLDRMRELEARDKARMGRLADEEVITQHDINMMWQKVLDQANRDRVRKAAITLRTLQRIERARIFSLSREWGKFTNDLQIVFTNTFSDMLSRGETSWKSFAKNLKNIFIRQLSEIAVSMAFKGIENLFNNFTANNFSSGQPAHADVGGLFGTPPPPILAPGTQQMAPGTINVIFPNADIEHMSQAQIERVVQKQIGPALLKMQRRGIMPRAM